MYNSAVFYPDLVDNLTFMVLNINSRLQAVKKLADTAAYTLSV